VAESITGFTRYWFHDPDDGRLDDIAAKVTGTELIVQAFTPGRSR
jgi:hypothetical protein